MKARMVLLSPLRRLPVLWISRIAKSTLGETIALLRQREPGLPLDLP
jgi:hypothetical protein